MNPLKFKQALPIVLGQLFLFICIQKLLFGINAYEPSGLSVYNYYGPFLLFLVLIIILFSFISSRDSEHLPSKTAVSVAGLLSVPGTTCLFSNIFDNFETKISIWAMIFCLVLISVTFCYVQFAWLKRLKKDSTLVGKENIVLYILFAALIYSFVTPSDANPTSFILVLEVISLPLSALLYSVSFETSKCAANNVDKFQGKDARSVISISAFFFIMLLISYTDVLNNGYPDRHFENPTFYVLLIISIAVLIAALYYCMVKGFTLDDMMREIIQIFGFLFLISYLFIFFYAGSSYTFCFEFTCFLRRFVAIAFYATILSLTLIYNFKMELVMGSLFFAPYFFAKALMMFSYIPVTTGMKVEILNLRLIVLLILGVFLIIFVTYYWYFYNSNAPRCNSLEFKEQPLHVSDARVKRENAILNLSQTYSFSEREKEVLYYVSMGYSVSKVAENLNIAKATAGTHIQSVYKKMNVHTKQDVIDLVNASVETLN